METDDHRKLLGAFVRAHRERLQPEGHPGRRRTPGLRREELAARAGISSTWCTWIEQGREVKASRQALGRLARALELSRAERAYLFDLAGQRDPEALTSLPVDDAPAAIRAAISGTRHPAYGLDRLWNACCWNKAAERLFTGWLGGNCQRNLLRFVFLDPAAKILIPNWKDRARRILAEFRADYSHTFNDPRVRSLVEGLQRDSALFSRKVGRRRWFGTAKAVCTHFRAPTAAHYVLCSTASALRNDPTTSWLSSLQSHEPLSGVAGL